jgi:hypothetical protein
MKLTLKQVSNTEKSRHKSYYKFSNFMDTIYKFCTLEFLICRWVSEQNSAYELHVPKYPSQFI